MADIVTTTLNYLNNSPKTKGGDLPPLPALPVWPVTPMPTLPTSSIVVSTETVYATNVSALTNAAMNEPVSALLSSAMTTNSTTPYNNTTLNEAKSSALLNATPLPTLHGTTTTATNETAVFNVTTENAASSNYNLTHLFSDTNDIINNATSTLNGTATDSDKLSGEESNQLVVWVPLAVLLAIILLASCISLVLCYRRRKKRATFRPEQENSSSNNAADIPRPLVAPSVNRSSQPRDSTEAEKSAEENIDTIEFKHAGSMELKTKTHPVVTHELDGDNKESDQLISGTSGVGTLVIDPLQNQVYEVGSDVELHTDGNKSRKPAKKARRHLR